MQVGWEESIKGYTENLIKGSITALTDMSVNPVVPFYCLSSWLAGPYSTLLFPYRHSGVSIMAGETFHRSSSLPSGNLQPVGQTDIVQFFLDVHTCFHNYNHGEARLRSFRKGGNFMKEKSWML